MLLLAPVTDPAAVPFALAAAMNLTVTHGDVLTACLAVLGDRPGVLVIDNCEHLLDAARDLVLALLSSCPRLAVLATSREPLGLAAEHTFRLAPLALPRARPGPVAVPGGRGLPRPSRAGAPRHSGADRAQPRRRHRPPPRRHATGHRARRRAAVDLLARRPARAASTAPSTCSAGRGPAATSDTARCAPPSSGPTSSSTRTNSGLFRHLAVFVDGVELDTAEQLAAGQCPGRDPGSVLARLVDASMLEAAFTGGTRYRMLETLRAFGLDRLAAAGDDDATGS